MMIVIFVLFVLYTLACIADGPDVKPVWKKWLGKRLEKMANRYYPIQYVQCSMPEIDSPFMRQTIQIQPAETKLIKSNTMFRVFPDIMLGKRAGRGCSDNQVQFSRCIKEGINHILFDIGKEAFRLGLVKYELVADRHDEVILLGEMKIVEPEHSMFSNPYVLFENSKIEVRYPEPFIDMGLIEEEQIQY